MVDYNLKQIKELYKKRSFSVALSIIQEKLSEADDSQNMWEYYFYLAQVQYMLGRNKDALKSIQKTLLLIKENQIEIKNMIEIQIANGKILRRNNKLQEAKQIYLDLLKKDEKYIDKEEKIKIYHNLANVYLELKEYKETERLLEKALSLSKELGKEEKIATVYSSLAALKYLLGDVDRALHYYSKSLEIREKLQDKQGKATLYFNIGTIYSNIQDRENAEKYLLKAINLFKTVNNQRGEIITKETLAIMYYNLGEIKETIKWLDHLIELPEYNLKQLPKAVILIDCLMKQNNLQLLEIILSKSLITINKADKNQIEKYWKEVFQIKYIYCTLILDKKDHKKALEILDELKKEENVRNNWNNVILVSLEKARIYENLLEFEHTINELEIVEEIGKKQKRDIKLVLIKESQIYFILGKYKKAQRKLESLKELIENKHKYVIETIIRSLKIALRQKVPDSTKLLEMDNKNIDYELVFLQNILVQIQKNSLQIKKIDKLCKKIGICSERLTFSNYLLVHKLLTNEELDRELYLESNSRLEQIYRRVIENQILPEEFREHFENLFQKGSWNYKEKSRILDILCIGVLNDLISKNVITQLSWKKEEIEINESLLNIKKILYTKIIEAHSLSDFQLENRETGVFLLKESQLFVKQLIYTITDFIKSNYSNLTREQIQTYLFIVVKVTIGTIEQLFLVDFNER
ncbi:MAG: tetratricopeptide repeat protein [Candidatus Heimdallarchaeum endolithica]|uniref:Tetratricopeptide repeat protein n=1 Tax=Candidatus Heimdallarchaeum endolithica TaxID=2876572 RepID=A0A9Y1FQP1_9ARCH|nr:MAG: tetratricopeptide repeat protein [Candidatus Heimdallarchaeum endolithica]